MAATKVPTRKLGKYGPEVPALGYGCMGLSSFYGKPRPDEERLKFLDHVYAAGETNWDSADIYGDSEDLLGKYVSRRFLFANPEYARSLVLRRDAASLESATSSRANID
jgi:predicted aldo/keto reductase-like oxidoreductase